MNFEKLAKIADSIMNPKTVSVSQIKDAKVGDPFDNGDVQGKILEIKTAEDGSKTVVVESQNEDGEVENVEVAITDSDHTDVDAELNDWVEDYKEANGIWLASQVKYGAYELTARQFADELGDIYDDDDIVEEVKNLCACNGVRIIKFFRNNDSVDWQFINKEPKISDGTARENDAMDLFVRELIGKRKAHCPKTGDWELTDTQIFNNGKKVYDLPEKVTVTNLTEIIPEVYKKVEEKIGDSQIQDDGYGYVPDQAMDELLDYGEALFPIPEGKNASDVWSDVDMILQSYVGPNGHVNSSYEEKDGGVYIKIEEEGTEIE